MGGENTNLSGCAIFRYNVEVYSGHKLIARYGAHVITKDPERSLLQVQADEQKHNPSACVVVTEDKEANQGAHISIKHMASHGTSPQSDCFYCQQLHEKKSSLSRRPSQRLGLEMMYNREIS